MRIPLKFIGQVAGASAWAEAGNVESSTSTRRHAELLLLQVPVLRRAQLCLCFHYQGWCECDDQRTEDCRR